MSKNITLSIPDNTFRKMKEFSDIRWSEVARKAIQKRILELSAVEKLVLDTAIASENSLAKSWLSKEDETAWKDL